MLATSKCNKNVLNKPLRNHKHETVYEIFKDVLVPSLNHFATKTVRGDVGKAASILDLGSR